MRLWLWASLLLLCATSAPAEPLRLRLATVAPAGTSWAREIQAFAREVETITGGGVQLKLYLGGIAGDEVQVLERIRRGQLDGATGSLVCTSLAPSLRVTRMLGLFRNRDEIHAVLEKLRPRVQSEMQQAGFAALGVATFGNVLVFSRRPIRSLAELRATRLWSWKLDETWLRLVNEIGLHVVPADFEDAERFYDDGRVDGIFAFPTAALAFQWSAHTRYFTDLELGALPACIVMSLRVLDALPLAQQAAIRQAAARLTVRFEERGRLDDEALVGGLFERQGVTRVRASEAFRSEFYDAARQARDRVGPQIVPGTLLAEVLTWLADYRAEHRR